MEADEHGCVEVVLEGPPFEGGSAWSGDGAEDAESCSGDVEGISGKPWDRG